MSLTTLRLVFVAAAFAAPLVAQETPTGTLAGQVIDAKTGQPISDVGVQIVGTTRGVQTGIDGRFRFQNVPAGTLTIQVRRIGYQPKQITGLFLDAGRTLEQPVSMDRAEVVLEAVTATAEAERGSVSAALDAQRNATAIVSSIGSEQISKSPDSDAAQALQRVSGVTVQDGKYLNVRGLDPRYTTASLNGARLPSPEPERKVVPFDLFPAHLLQAVVTSKTFTPDQPADFSGGSVDLRTRESPFETQRSYSVSFGVNDAIMGRKINLAPGTGGDPFGFGYGPRQLPSVVSEAGKLDRNFTQQEYNQFVDAFRNAWSARQGRGRPATSVSLSAGGTAPIGGREIGYVGAFSYSYGQEVRADERRAFALPTQNGGTDAVDPYVGSTGRESALWGGLLNFSSLVGTRHRVTLNNTFTRSADNEARFENGYDENAGFPFDITRLRYVQRAVISTKLGGEHEVSDRQRVDWGLTGSHVTRAEPDRSEVAYVIDSAGAIPFLYGGAESAVRTFGDLWEYNLNATANYFLRFGGGDHLFKLGGLGRYTDRDSHVRSYGLQASLPRAERERPPEEIFGSYTAPSDSVFRLSPLSQAGDYTASDVLGAGYAMLEYQITPRIRAIVGSRVEVQDLSIIVEPSVDAPVTVSRTYFDVLPSLAFNVNLTDRNVLRFSASQTLARPEYRENVPIASRDVLGGEQFRGNVNLRRTLIQNADLRWEFYPSRGEIISLAAFAKHFDRPIERVYRGTSGTRVTTFENANSAMNIGGELELRKNLGMLSGLLEPWTVFSNLTVMHSAIDIGDIGGGSVEQERAMVGQAPYVVNAGLTYAGRRDGLTATALYNVIGRRIAAASLLPLPSVYEESRHVVDFSVRVPLRRGIAAKLDLKNLLDAPYEVTQGTVEREYYRSGRSLSLGLSWGN
ncbi:MAG: carboxypeptidase regulatory-like domain-containing protein [Gemmatimonadaceae bacterium]